MTLRGWPGRRHRGSTVAAVPSPAAVPAPRRPAATDLRARLADARVLYPLLFLAAAALSAITILKGIQPNDEGLMLQAAARIAGGEVPYRDFWWFYPPGQPYLLGGLWSVFGPSLLVWRIVRVIADATVAVLAFSLARRAAPTPLALAAWLCSALAMASPDGPAPVPDRPGPRASAPCCASSGRRPGRACSSGSAPCGGSSSPGISGWASSWPTPPPRPRPASARAGPGGSRRARRHGDRALRAGRAGGGPRPLLGSRSSATRSRTSPTTRRLPFPLHYDGPLNTSSIAGFLADTAEPLVLFFLPLALVIGLAGALLVLGLRWSRERDWPRACHRRVRRRDGPLPARARRRVPHRTAGGDGLGAGGLGDRPGAAARRRGRCAPPASSPRSSQAPPWSTPPSRARTVACWRCASPPSPCACRSPTASR